MRKALVVSRNRPILVVPGDLWSSTLAESLFKTLIQAPANDKGYKTRVEAKQDAFKHIKPCRKKRRIHSALGYMSPAEFKEANWPDDEGRPRAA